MKIERFGGAALCVMGVLIVTGADAAPPPITVPVTVQLPQLEPLVPPCADPAADHFLEIDISKRPPPDSTPVQRISAWITNDGMFHWPFVMRIRNIGDQPFIGKAGKQSAVLTEDDLAAETKGKVLAAQRFDRIEPHSGVAVRFEFTTPADNVQRGRFHRIYTLKLKYDEMSDTLLNGRYGDCNMRNNSFFVEFDGSRKGWLFGK